MKNALLIIAAVTITLFSSCTKEDKEDSNIKTLTTTMSFDTDIPAPEGTAMLFNLNKHVVEDYTVGKIYSEQMRYLYYIQDVDGDYIFPSLREPFDSENGSRESVVTFYSNEVYLGGNARDLLFVIDLTNDPQFYTYKMISFGLENIELEKVFESKSTNDERQYVEW